MLSSHLISEEVSYKFEVRCADIWGQSLSVKCLTDLKWGVLTSEGISEVFETDLFLPFLFLLLELWAIRARNVWFLNPGGGIWAHGFFFVWVRSQWVGDWIVWVWFMSHLFVSSVFSAVPTNGLELRVWLKRLWLIYIYVSAFLFFQLRALHGRSLRSIFLTDVEEGFRLLSGTSSRWSTARNSPLFIVSHTTALFNPRAKGD